jgi:hypothetical protein
MSKTIDTSRLGHATLEDHLTEGELNAVVGGLSLLTYAVRGAFKGAMWGAGGPGDCPGDYGVPHQCQPSPQGYPLP